MSTKLVTSAPTRWGLTAQEVAHAMPVLQHVHRGLRDAPAPRLAIIRGLAQRQEVRDGALRTALSRACASGSLTLSDGYRLGPRSLAEAASARALLARTHGYVLAIVPEGAESDQAQLREVFARLGFRSLQRSVWIGARTVEDRLGAGLEQEGLAGSALVFQAEEVDADARARLAKSWRLHERIADLRAFHHDLAAYLTDGRLSPTEAAWRCVEAAPVWYRVAVRDEPPFPLDLCGEDYPLEPLNAFWRAHLQGMTGDLLALWKGLA